MFGKHSETLENQHDQTRETSRDFEQVIDWKMHILDRPHDMPILDNLQAKMTEAIIETWENICDSMEAIIREVQLACKHRWSSYKVFLGYLDLPVLDLIAQAPLPEIQLEQVEQHFDVAKEQIQQINQLTLQEIERWIENPYSLMALIQVYLKEWKKLKKKEITSQIYKTKIHLKHSHFQEIDELMNLHAKWRFALAKPLNCLIL